MRAQTLKGRNNVIPPFQGLRCVGPGRSQGDALGCNSAPFQGKENTPRIGQSEEPARGDRQSILEPLSRPPKVSRTLAVYAVESGR